MSIDWKNIERSEPLPATVANMRRVEHVPGVVVLSEDGEEFSATPGDYFMLSEDELAAPGGVLVAQRVYWIDPLTGNVAA